jgi:hypothetical protein
MGADGARNERAQSSKVYFYLFGARRGTLSTRLLWSPNVCRGCVCVLGVWPGEPLPRRPLIGEPLIGEHSPANLSPANLSPANLAANLDWPDLARG